MKVECCNVSKSIRGAEVLKNIELVLEPGKVYGLWGKNGCGKTMLMRIISGLIRPSKGKVLIDGKELWKDIAFPPDMGIMIENPAFLSSCTGLQNLKNLASIRQKVSEEHIREIMKAVGLSPDDKRKYRKYSLGMKQRLGIACAIMEVPELVLLDEPINALDESGVELVGKLIREYRDKGCVIVISCHDKEEMNSLADQVFCMAEGKIEKSYLTDKSAEEEQGHEG